MLSPRIDPTFFIVYARENYDGAGTRAERNPKHASAIDFIVFGADGKYFDSIIEDERRAISKDY